MRKSSRSPPAETRSRLFFVATYRCSGWDGTSSTSSSSCGHNRHVLNLQSFLQKNAKVEARIVDEFVLLSADRSDPSRRPRTICFVGSAAGAGGATAGASLGLFSFNFAAAAKCLEVKLNERLTNNDGSVLVNGRTIHREYIDQRRTERI